MLRIFNTQNWSLQKRESMAAYFYISPWIVGFLIFTLGPMLVSFGLSFTDYNSLTQGTPKFVALDNYIGLLDDADFWQSLKVTVTFAAMSLPSGLVLSFLLAILLNQKIPFVNVWRTVYFLPSVLAGVAVTILWMLIFNPQLGALNLFLGVFGIDGPGWLKDPNYALLALTIMGLWGVGGSMIVYLAGLQGVPTDLYDASKVDGANANQRFWNVTLPMMTPVLFYNLVLGLIGTFSYFTTAYLVGKEDGAPLKSTLFYNLNLYRTAFKYFEMGKASALAWVLFIIILVLTLLVFRSSELWVFYEGELRGKKSS
jgi:multiple sugar transport system permease protein